MPGRRGGPEMLERDEQLIRVDQLLAEATDGRGAFVIVEAGPGMGKSSLLASVRAAGKARAFEVLRARGAELEGDFPFGVVRQLFEATLETGEPQLFEGAAGQARALLGTSLAPERPGPDEAPFAALNGLYWLCSNLVTARGPLLIAIDDADRADLASLRFLTFIASRLPDLPVVVVITVSPESLAAAPATLGTLAVDPAVELLRPAALTESAVARMLEAELGSEPAAEFVVAAHDVTGGTPFLLRALADGLREAGIEPGAAAAAQVAVLGTHSVGRWLAVRLGRLSSTSAALAEAVSILEHGSLHNAAELARLAPEEARSAADAMIAALILGPGPELAFSQLALRAAVYEGMGAARRATGHGHAARVLAAAGAPVEIVVQHLSLAEPAGDPNVVEQLVAAARVASRRGAPESAANYLRRALAEPPAPDRRSEILLDLGAAESAAGWPGAEDTLRAAIGAANSPEGRVLAALALNHAFGRDQRFREGLAVLDEVARSLPATAGPEAELIEAAVLISAMLDAEVAPRYAERLAAARTRATGTASASRELLALAALAALQANAPFEEPAALARRALASGPLPLSAELPWFPLATGTLVWTGHFADAESALDGAVTEARRTRDPVLFVSAHSYRGLLALRTGDPRRAEAEALSVLEADLPVPGLYRILATAVLCEALVVQARLDDAERALVPVSGLVELPLQPAAILRHARGRLRFAQSRVHDALADQLGTGEVMHAAGVTSPAFLAWRSEAALMHLVLGDRDEAERLAREEVELTRAFGAPRPLARALRSAALILDDTGADMLTEAEALLRDDGAELQLAEVLAVVGARLRRANQRQRSRAPLEEAARLADKAGAARLLEVIETDLDALGARPRTVMTDGVEALTASERRVAHLAANGLTNPQIAQALFVTTRTVEGHLSQAFGQLQVSARGELEGALAAG